MDPEHILEHIDEVGSFVPRGNEEVEQPPVTKRGQPAQPEQLLETMARYLDMKAEAAAAGSSRDRENRLYEQFMKYKPPTFAGTGEPTDAEEWFRQMEVIFDIMGIDEEMKVKLAAFHFVDRARYWWKDAKARLTTPRVGSQEIPRVTWGKFEEELNDKYFSEAYRNE